MSTPDTANQHNPGNPASPWLGALRRYLAFMAVANLVWEFAHMPLYTLWNTGSTEEIIFAAVHCTGGDILIALSSIMLSMFLFGNGAWPTERHLPVIVGAVTFGLAYTIFSEWLNIEVREAWAYRDLMPVIPVLGTGLSPIMQWIIVPLVAYRFALGAAGGGIGRVNRLEPDGDAL